MATSDAPREIRQLIAELHDYNKERRRKAVYKLGMIGGHEAVQALIHAVQNDTEDVIVRGRAAQMLGHLREESAVDALISALNAPGHQTAVHVTEALGLIGGETAVKALQAVHTYHHNERARKSAESALLRLGQPTTLTPVMAFEPEVGFKSKDDIPELF